MHTTYPWIKLHLESDAGSKATVIFISVDSKPICKNIPSPNRSHAHVSHANRPLTFSRGRGKGIGNTNQRNGSRVAVFCFTQHFCGSKYIDAQGFQSQRTHALNSVQFSIAISRIFNICVRVRCVFVISYRCESTSLCNKP